jgi:hypothetical protein
MPASRKDQTMWNKPSREELAQLPAFYSTEDVPLKDKVIVMHFFIGGCDWWACEYDPASQMFFGFAVLNNNLDMAEWGYFSLVELDEIRVTFIQVDRDLYWAPRKAIEVDKIRKSRMMEERVSL